MQNKKTAVDWFVNLLDLEFTLIQYKFYRKWKGGTYYLISNWLPMCPFWSKELITNCGGRAIKIEYYGN